MIEFEKKYLVKYLPENLESCQKVEIMQGYLTDNPSLRVRQYDYSDQQVYVITLKIDDPCGYRDEIETELTKEQFNNLSKLVTSNWINKTRYYVPLNDLWNAEVDIYHDELNGLRTVEVEFLNEIEADEFTAPEWFGEDVTHDKKYENAQLAFKGLGESCGRVN